MRPERSDVSLVPPRGVVSNPFEEDGSYRVLRNDEAQFSLWPASVDVPAGWRTVLNDTSRQDCLAFIEENWTDMRPSSLRAAMASAAHPPCTTEA